MNAIELEAGPELDAAVAKAIGLKGEIFRGKFCVGMMDLDELHDPNGELRTVNLAVNPWSPSTSLDAAFQAADRCVRRWGDYHGRPMSEKLFERYHLTEYDGTWSFYENGEGAPDDAIASGPTPELAICRAILALNWVAKPAAPADEHSPPAR
jgi:hypothetical protein